MRLAPSFQRLLLVTVLVSGFAIVGTATQKGTDAPAAGPAAAREPELLVPDVDASWRQVGKHRSQIGLALRLTDTVAGIAFLAYVAFSGHAFRVREWLSARIGRPSIVRLLFIGLTTVSITLVGFPFDVARYAVSLWFGVGRQPFASWMADQGIGLLVNMASAAFLGSLFYVLVARRPRTWWRWVTAAGVPLSMLAVLLTPLYIELFNTFAPLKDRDTASHVLALAARAGVPADEVFVIDMSRQTRAANAFVTGLGPTATIAFGDTLLENFSREETLFVMAHEMGHYVHKHLWIGLAIAVVMTAAGAYILQRFLDRILARHGSRLGYGALADVASLPLVLFAVAVLSFAAEPIGNIASREMESDADRFALELTVPSDVSVEAAASTFERLGQLGLSDPNPHPVIRFLFWSHPTLDERIALVRKSAGLPAGAFRESSAP